MRQSRLKGLEVFARGLPDSGISSQPVSEGQDRVIGAHVPIHGDSVEARGHRFVEGALKRLSSNVGIRGDEAQHRGMQSGRYPTRSGCRTGSGR